MIEIFFIQPGFAHYRNDLFSLLSKRHSIHFVYERSFNVYPGKVSPGVISHVFIDVKYRHKWIGLPLHLLKYRPNIVISSVSFSFRTLIAFIYAKLFKKRMILWILEWKTLSHSNSFLKSIYNYVREIIRVKIIRSSDSIVVGSTASYNYALSLKKNKRNIFLALQSSIDVSMVAKNKIKNLNQNKKNGFYTFLYVGRIIPYKGLDLLIKAFSLLYKDRKDIRLLIAGDGSFRAYCEKLSNSLKIDNIIFYGSIDPSLLFDVYSIADVFILPAYFRENRYEVWGLVINEAISMGLPIITTKAVGAAYDLVIDGQNGFVVDDNNIFALYQAMKNILQMDLQFMGYKSREIFLKQNDYNKMADGFTAAIEYVKSH